MCRRETISVMSTVGLLKSQGSSSAKATACDSIRDILDEKLDVLTKQLAHAPELDDMAMELVRCWMRVIRSSCCSYSSLVSFRVLK